MTKVILVGSCGVGKTSIVKVITSGLFEEEYNPTVGAEYNLKVLGPPGEEVKIQFWDTAGEEKFQAMAPIYYHDAKIGLVVFAMDDQYSFDRLISWINSINDNTEGVRLIVVGNKSDKEDKAVKTEQAISLANEFKAEYVEVSAKTGARIQDLCDIISDLAKEKEAEINQKQNEQQSLKRVSESSTQNNQQGSKCC